MQRNRVGADLKQHFNDIATAEGQSQAGLRVDIDTPLTAPKDIATVDDIVQVKVDDEVVLARIVEDEGDMLTLDNGKKISRDEIADELQHPVDEEIAQAQARDFAPDPKEDIDEGIIERMIDDPEVAEIGRVVNDIDDIINRLGEICG